MANKQDLQEDECSHLREEFRQVIVPLIQKSLHDKPTDITAYCASYFQGLLEKREKNIISGYESGKKTATREPFPLAQESASEPLLTEVPRNSLPLRGTSSWNSPSSMPRRLWDISRDVADAMSHIGDQPDPKDAKLDGVRGTDNQLSVGGEGSREKEYDERNGDFRTLKFTDHNIALPFDNEIEDELSAIVNLAAYSTSRKKWSSTDDLENQVELKSKFSKDNDDGQEIASSNNESPNSSWNNTSTFVSIPQLKELATLASAKNSSTPFIQKEVENAVKSISRSLQELIKVLDTMKSICNENLQKVKILGEVLPKRSQPVPRKKRSVTTFSSSDNEFQSKEISCGSRNKPGSGKSCSKMSQSKGNNCELQLDSVRFDLTLKDKSAEEEFTKSETKLSIEKNIACISENLISDEGSSLYQNMERNGRSIKDVKILDPKNIHANDKSRCKEGVVNKGFVMEDEESHKKFNGHGQQHHHGQSSWSANSYGYRRRMFRDPHAFSEIRFPRPCPGRNGKYTRQHNLANRQMLRLDSRFSNIGEGGDVFTANLRQRSVATETEATQTTERADAERIQEASTSKKTESHVSEKEPYNHMNLLSDENSPKLSEDVPAENGSDAEGEKKEVIKIDIKLSKKSSSLNPCAECFNPPSKLVQNLEASKSLKDNEASDLANTSPFRQSTINYLEAEDTDSEFIDFQEDMWDYETFENDQEPILYQNVDSEGRTISLTLEEIEDQHKFESEVCNSECDLLLPESYHELLQRHDEPAESKKRLSQMTLAEGELLQGPSSNELLQGPSSNELLQGPSSNELLQGPAEREDTRKRPSEMTLAEGDLGLEREQAPESNSTEKQEEPGLNSACGDFVASEREENSREDSSNLQVVECDAGVSDLLPLNVENSASENRRQEEEEMELNFACFSGSDSSEVDSSDISADEFSEENNETKLEEKA